MEWKLMQVTERQHWWSVKPGCISSRPTHAWTISMKCQSHARRCLIARHLFLHRVGLALILRYTSLQPKFLCNAKLQPPLLQFFTPPFSTSRLPCSRAPGALEIELRWHRHLIPTEACCPSSPRRRWARHSRCLFCHLKPGVGAATSKLSQTKKEIKRLRTPTKKQ